MFRKNFTPVSCGNRDELVFEQNSLRYHVKGPLKFLFPEHHALLSFLNAKISIALKQQPAFNYLTATETIRDHIKHML